MGRAFEYRKARKLKRWGNMARTFTKIGKEIEIAVKSGGPDPTAQRPPRILIQNAKPRTCPRECRAGDQTRHLEGYVRLQGGGL